MDGRHHLHALVEGLPDESLTAAAQSLKSLTPEGRNGYDKAKALKALENLAEIRKSLPPVDVVERIREARGESLDDETNA